VPPLSLPWHRSRPLGPSLGSLVPTLAGHLLLGRVGGVQVPQDGQELVTVAPFVLSQAPEPLGRGVVADRLGLGSASIVGLLGRPAHDRTGAAGALDACRSRLATGPTSDRGPGQSPFEGRLAPHSGAVQPFAGRPGPASVETTPEDLLRWRCTMRRTVQDVMTREVVAVRGPTPLQGAGPAAEQAPGHGRAGAGRRRTASGRGGSELQWQAEDAWTQVPPAEPAPLS
jgi:hypothetical protein